MGRRVRTLTEASFVLQRAAHACGLLSNQRGLLAHSYSLRLSLLNALFLRVLPLPPPVIPNEATLNEADYATPSAAFWRRAAAEVRGRVRVRLTLKVRVRVRVRVRVGVRVRVRVRVRVWVWGRGEYSV